MSTRKNVLIVGSGGREHALAAKMAESPSVGKLLISPGNDGIAAWAETLTAASGARVPEIRCVPLPTLRSDGWGRRTFESLSETAHSEGIDLVVIGPDDPLALGVTDFLEAKGLCVFGPSRSAARLEWSKAFAKEILREVCVPTARSVEVTSGGEIASALVKIGTVGTIDAIGAIGAIGAISATGATGALGKAPYVVKADGLALGKGVEIHETVLGAERAARGFLEKHGRVVIEEFLQGEEVSVLALCDGFSASLFETARDYKRAFDGGEGPNTGGMGAYSPVSKFETAPWKKRFLSEVFEPVLREMRRRGTPFKGVLYAGLMVAGNQFWVLEFNARFGDPETQVLLPRVDDDLFLWLDACARGTLGRLSREIPMTKNSTVSVTLAAKGYPDCPTLGTALPALRSFAYRDAARVFAAGLKRRSKTGAAADTDVSGNGFVTNGGRVLHVVGEGATLDRAKANAYERLREVLSVPTSGVFFRKDIGS